VFRGKSETGQDSWGAHITQVTETEALVFAFAYYGYSAKLVLNNGRWLLMNWQLVVMQ
jgi:hypothetical protein